MAQQKYAPTLLKAIPILEPISLLKRNRQALLPNRTVISI